MFNIDLGKLAAIQERLQNATKTAKNVTTGITAELLQCKNSAVPRQSPSKPAAFRNVKRQDRKAPAAYTKVRNVKTGEIAESHAAKQSRLAARQQNTETALRRAKKPGKQITSVPDKVAASQVADESPAAKQKRLRREANELLAKDKAAKLADQLTRQPERLDPNYRNILQEIAGYDPNEVQGKGDVIFRPKAGGRKNKRSAHRFQYTPTSQQCEEITEELQEVVAKIGDLDVHYVHRDVPPGMPYLSERHLHNLQFPDATVTDDDVRVAVNESLEPRHALLTTQEDVIQQIEQTMYRKANGMEISSDLDDNDAPTKCEVSVFNPDSKEYKMLQAVNEFSLAFVTG